MKSLEEVKYYAAQEAIISLGLLKGEAFSTVVGLLDDCLTSHPKNVCSSYRKIGEQISDELKKSLGIRKNAFLSIEAFNQITEKGLESPLDAHKKTLLRAVFSIFRYRSIESLRELERLIDRKYISLTYDVQNDACEFCRNLDAKFINDPEDVIIPSKNCSCITPNYSINTKVDWIGESIDKEKNKEKSQNGMWKSAFSFFKKIRY